MMNWWTKPEWWSAIGTVLAVVVALFVALFNETWWAFFRRPKLQPSIKLGRPDCMKTTQTDTTTGQVVADCYYFRILVKNNGKRRAEKAELHAEILEKEIDDTFQTVDDFPPMRLKWSHVAKPEQDISPGVAKHCDLGYIALPKRLNVHQTAQLSLGDENQFCFVLEVQPNQGGWQIGAGTYRLHIAFAAANAAVKRAVFEIRYDGYWTFEESEMFAKHIDIRQL